MNRVPVPDKHQTEQSGRSMDEDYDPRVVWL